MDGISGLDNWEFLLLFFIWFVAPLIGILVVLVGLGGGVFWIATKQVPASRFVRANMAVSAVILVVAFIWWLTLAIAHNIQGL
jgi:hypothetical protein